MRRPAPRRLATPLAGWANDSAPPTVLARVQGCWASVAGPAIAAEASPVAERAGTLTIACGSAVWAAELELLAPDLLAGLNEALAAADGAALTSLRVRLTGAS